MKIAAATVAAIALIAPGPALAADYCSQTTIVATTQMAPDADGLAVIPVTLGPASKTMIVDTGAAISEVTQATVDEMHLPTFRNQFGMYNPAGNFSEKAVGISPFGIGGVSTKSYTFRVGQNTPGSAAGTIAADVLRAYDLDFDFGGGKFNLVSPDHCVGKVVYWQTSTVAVVPVTVTPEGRIVLPLTIDGHALKAVLDTGSSGSSISEDAARALGASSGAGTEQSYQALALEGLSVTNPRLSVVKQLRDSTGKPVDAATGAGVTLGMNVLRHLHLYVAYREQRLYFTPK